MEAIKRAMTLFFVFPLGRYHMTPFFIFIDSRFFFFFLTFQHTALITAFTHVSAAYPNILGLRLLMLTSWATSQRRVFLEEFFCWLRSSSAQAVYFKSMHIWVYAECVSTKTRRKQIMSYSQALRVTLFEYLCIHTQWKHTSLCVPLLHELFDSRRVITMRLHSSMSCKTCGYVSACTSVFQTPGLWIDEGVEQGSPHQRSASWGSADHLKEVDSPTLTSFSAKSQLLLTTNTADGGLTKGSSVSAVDWLWATAGQTGFKHSQTVQRVGFCHSWGPFDLRKMCFICQGLRSA